MIQFLSVTYYGSGRNKDKYQASLYSVELQNNN